MNLAHSFLFVNSNENDFSTLLGARLRTARELKGYTREKIYEMTGISTRSIQNYEDGSRSPKVSDLVSLVIALQCDPTWLLTGQEVQSSVSIDDGPYFRAPVAGEAGAGPAVENHIAEIKDEAVLSVGIKRRYGAGDYVAVWVRGDSMAPLLPHGAMVAVRKDHLALGSLKWEHVYLVNVPQEGGPVLKKVSCDPKQGFITLHSVNPAYPPVTYNLKTDDVKIIGRAVGVIWAPL